MDGERPTVTLPTWVLVFITGAMVAAAGAGIAVMVAAIRFAQMLGR